MKYGKIKMIALKSRHIHLFGEEVLDGAAIITGLLSTVYKLDKKQIDSVIAHGKILKDGETSTDVATADSILTFMSGLDATRVTKLKTDAQDGKYQEGYAKAKGEALHEAEKAFKEKYGVESNLKGTELVDFIVKDQLTKAGKVDVTNEEEVKKSSAYQAMEKKLLKDMKELKEAGEAKVKELETTYKKEGTFTKVGQSALDILNGLNPILPKNATVADTYKKDFLNELKGFQYEEKDGKILVSDSAGKLLEDAHGNTLTWEEHVKKIAGNRFEFAVNNDGKNAGDKTDPKKKDQPVAYPAGINKPKTEDELSTIMNSNLKPAEKRVVLTEYESRTTAK